MGWLDWLFGEEEEESNPEFLVLGAKLKCVYGSTNSYLYVDSDNMNINHLPEACVSDSQALYNILPFGQCVMGGPCSAMMKIGEEWYNPKPQTKEVNGKEAITTDSTLVCAATGMLIEAVSSGQDGVFANQLLFMQEMDVLYPGLRELLEDPYGSLYLKDGMYELGIQFLQDRMEANGGSIEIFAMDTQNSLEASYITAAFERLLPYVDTRAPGSFFDGLQTVICKAGVENGADAHVLNADLIEVLQADCGDYARKVSDGGYYKYQEENKMFLNWLGESSMSMAYGVMVYQSLVNWKPGSRNVYESNEEVSEVKEVESETNEGGGSSEGGSSPQIINNKFPSDNQKGKTFDYTIENGNVKICDGIQEADFVIDMDGNLHIGRGHSYLANGNSVQAAGKMKVNSKGYIRNIINDSGHYQPTVSEALNYPNILRSTGLNVDNAWIRVDSFTSSLSNYVIDSKVFYNGPVKYLPH